MFRYHKKCGSNTKFFLGANNINIWTASKFTMRKENPSKIHMITNEILYELSDQKLRTYMYMYVYILI